MKQKIRLSESDIRKIIRQCVNEAFGMDGKVESCLKDIQRNLFIRDEEISEKIADAKEYLISSDDEDSSDIVKVLDKVQSIIQDIEFVQEDIEELLHQKPVASYMYKD